MRKIKKKFLTVLLVAIIILGNILPVSSAVYENLEKKPKENIIINDLEKSYESVSNETKESNNDISNFEVLLAGILYSQEKKFTCSEVKDIIKSKPILEKGIWIAEESRDYIIDIINSLTNENYIIDSNGFLIIDEENPKSQEDKKDKYNYYTEKINYLINNQKNCIVVSIEETYKNLNEYDNDILDMIIEDSDYALLFKNDNSEENVSDIVVLNGKLYNMKNENDTKIDLFNKFLETLFCEDEEFNEFVQNQKSNENDWEVDKNNSIYANESSNNNDLENKKSDDIITDNEESLNNSEVNKQDNNIIIKNNYFDDRISEEQFKIILSGMSNDTQEENNLNYVNNKGIWIAKDSRENFIKFINKYTIYTYSVDNNGYLICDNIVKDNPNLDLLENIETEVDKEIKRILEKDVFIAIGINSSYKIKEDNKIVYKLIDNSKHKITFSYNGNRIILLNQKYYLLDVYDVALSDYFVKSLDNVEEKSLENNIEVQGKIAAIDNSNTFNAKMKSAQNVYAGPDSSNYAKVGSVSERRMGYYYK